MQSRSGIAASASIPSCPSSRTRSPARQAVLDGEIAVLDEKGVSRFHLIQPRIANTDPNAIAHLARSTPGGLFRRSICCIWMATTCAAWPWPKRRELLRGRRHARRRSSASPRHFPALATSCWKRRAKPASKASSPSAPPVRYESKRSRDWVKIKLVERAGVRDLRLHRAARRSRPLRRAGAGRR